MKHKKTITSVVFILLGLGGLHAQESPTAAGGDATGAGGSSSYTVGQVVYTTATGTNGSVAQGVQQPYEISVTTGVKETTINLELAVYPNPTTDFLQLNVGIQKFESISFHLFDMQGKLIESNKLTSNNTTIKMESLPKATYFLKVTNNKQVVKTLKIIKQ
jgi:hypothetical protein